MRSSEAWRSGSPSDMYPDLQKLGRGLFNAVCTLSRQNLTQKQLNQMLDGVSCVTTTDQSFETEVRRRQDMLSEILSLDVAQDESAREIVESHVEITEYLYPRVRVPITSPTELTEMAMYRDGDTVYIERKFYTEAGEEYRTWATVETFELNIPSIHFQYELSDRKIYREEEEDDANQ